MEIVYFARLAWQDLLIAVGASTLVITRWYEACDRKLFRIVRYISGAVSWRQIGFIGDSPSNLQLGLFSDADVAGDRAGMR